MIISIEEYYNSRKYNIRLIIIKFLTDQQGTSF